MTNSKLLKEIIAKSGFKMSYIAGCLGISRQGLWKKINNKSLFNQYDIDALCIVLSIESLELKEKIFFAPDVDKNAYGMKKEA